MGMVKIAATSEIPAGGMRTFEINGTAVLVANVAGKFYAIAEKCTHLGGPLGKGQLDGKVVTCPRHGAQFDVTTGEALAEARIAFLKMKVKNEPSFRVEVSGEDLLIEMP